jgi:RNA polymerase sigma factor (sigma-70 family)
MRDMSDLELLRNYSRQGSEEAFAELVRRHINLVYSVALRHVGSAASAEEIAQAVFVILARKADSLRPATVLESWLYQATRLTSLSFLRGERRRQLREQEAFMQSTTQPTDAPIWNQLAPLLDEAIACLGQKDREAVVLRFFHEKSLGDVAAASRMTESAAQSRVHRAVEKLRKFFLKRGLLLTTATIAGNLAANSVQAAPAGLAKSVTAIAVAKGATASGSTIVLIKAALKLMAWTKVKTVAGLAAVTMLGAGTTIVAVQAAHAIRAAGAPDIQGAWEGVELLGGPGVQKRDTTHTRVVLKIHKTSGVYSATADAIDLGLKDIPITKVVYDFPNVRFDLKSWTSFQGTVNAEGTKMTFVDTVMERTTNPDTVPKRLAESDFAPRAGSALQGCWLGEFHGVPVYWKIAEPTDGTFRGELDNPLVGENHKPFSVSYQNPTVTLTVLYGTGIFQGQINRARTEIAGSWLQRGIRTPVTLKRVDYLPEPPHPESLYSFRSKTDLQGHWKTVLDSRMAAKFMGLQPVKQFAANLDIARLPDGTFSAGLVLPLTALVGLGDPMPASTFQYQPPNVRVEWKALGGVFSGTLKSGKLTGNLRIFGASLPVTFER